MKSRTSKILLTLTTHIAALAVGGLIVHFASDPANVVWGKFLGDEIHSEASFPRGHMARIYSAWGFGDQQLIFAVDGRRVYQTPDFAPGNVNEEIDWDASGSVVTFSASSRRIFTYDTISGIGTKEE